MYFCMILIYAEIFRNTAWKEKIVFGLVWDFCQELFTIGEHQGCQIKATQL